MEASHLITEIKGVGVKTTALFSKLHIETIKDLISYFPRGYDHYEEALPVGELCTGKVQSVRACIVGTPSMVRAKGMVITHAQAGDASGRMKLTWFRMPYLKKALPGGSWHVFRGMVQAGAGGMLFMEQPRVFSQGDYETLAGTWQPKYTLTSGLTNHMISKCVRQALEELELPVVIHEREAHGDALTIIDEYPSVKGVFHCFSGSPELANELVRRGWYIGFTGVVTFKNARKAVETAKSIPLNRILIETDCPYMAPEPYRGRRNDPSYVPLVAQKIAELRGLPAATVAQATWDNARKLFCL